MALSISGVVTFAPANLTITDNGDGTLSSSDVTDDGVLLSYDGDGITDTDGVLTAA
jgi:hypothetical protein